MRCARGSIVGLVAVVLVSLAAACSPGSRYRVLSAIFDGVPVPESGAEPDSALVIAEVDLDPGPAVEEYQGSRHAVYRPRECDTCHDESQGRRLIEPVPTLCYGCHETMASRYRELHAPVAAGACTECHSPHMAPNRRLLLRSGSNLCLHCHVDTDLLGTRQHGATVPEECLGCHGAHGWSDGGT